MDGGKSNKTCLLSWCDWSEGVSGFSHLKQEQKRHSKGGQWHDIYGDLPNPSGSNSIAGPLCVCVQSYN